MKNGSFFCILFLKNFTKNIFCRKKQGEQQQTIYECELKEGTITSKKDRLVTNIYGTHVHNKTSNDVKSFLTYKKQMSFMPKGIEQVFKNLIILDIYSADLLEVHIDDLQPFPELRYISFMFNKLETIEFDLFVYNPKLEFLVLYGNRIQFVNDAFDILPSLRFLSFEQNRCYSGEAKDDRLAVLELMKKIHEKCGVDYKKAAQECRKDLMNCVKNNTISTQ